MSLQETLETEGLCRRLDSALSRLRLQKTHYSSELLDLNTRISEAEAKIQELQIALQLTVTQPKESDYNAKLEVLRKFFGHIGISVDLYGKPESIKQTLKSKVAEKTRL